MASKYRDDPEKIMEETLKGLSCNPNLPEGYVEAYIESKRLRMKADEIMKPFS